MGAATEQRSFSEILKLFGGPVREFRKPPPDSPFSGGREPGQVTDDSGQMLRMAQAIIESNGSLTVDGVVKQLLQWADDPEVFRRFAGPTTRAAIEELRKGTDPRVVGRQGRLTSLRTSNGAAIRLSPTGLAHFGDRESTARQCVSNCPATLARLLDFYGARAGAVGIAL